MPEWKITKYRIIPNKSPCKFDTTVKRKLSSVHLDKAAQIYKKFFEKDISFKMTIPRMPLDGLFIEENL